MLSVKYIPMQYYDAIIIRFTGDDGLEHNIFVDGGNICSRTFCYTNRLKNELELLFAMGESIDLWVITHIDNDHIGGLYHFINDSEFFETHHERLKEVWMNYGGKGDYEVQRTGTIGYHSGKELRDLLKEKRVNVKQDIIAGHTSTLFDATITVVAPDESALKRYVEWWNNNEFKAVTQTADGLIKGGEWDYNKKFKDFNMESYEEDSEVKNNSSILLSAKNQKVSNNVSAVPINRYCGFIFQKVSPPFRQRALLLAVTIQILPVFSSSLSLGIQRRNMGLRSTSA